MVHNRQTEHSSSLKDQGRRLGYYIPAKGIGVEAQTKARTEVQREQESLLTGSNG